MVYDSARRRDNLETRWWALVMLVELAVRTGNFEAVTPWLEEAERLAERIPHPVEHIRLGVLRSKVAIHDGAVEEALAAADAAWRLTRGRVVSVPWAVEGYSGLVETYLDLLESGVTDRGSLLTNTRRSHRLLYRFAATFPLARPRRLLVRGRLAHAMGRRRVALRCWRRAARRAEILHMPWEAAEARRLLNACQDEADRALRI